VAKTKVFTEIDDFRGSLRDAVARHGGACNFHAHFDRNHTLSSRYLAHFGMPPRDAPRAPLQVKQGLVGALHTGPAYEMGDLELRMRYSLDASIAQGVKRLVTCIDATPDIGHRAIDAALRLREEYEGQLRLEVVPHPIFGFKEDPRFTESRWDVFRTACEKCDGVGSLPERDIRDDSVGPTEHLRRAIQLGKKLKKPVYVHVGQANDPTEHDIFELIDAVKWLDYQVGRYEEPVVWVVHNISSANFSESDFARVIEGMREYRIGLICCPRAALSMRQNRVRSAPIHNSVARVLDLAYAGVDVRLGFDNIADLFVPTSTEDMLDQAIVLADMLRFYDVGVLAKFVAGRRLNDNDKEVIRQYLRADLEAFRRTDSNFEYCLPL
jgi:cytosine deaminase